MITVRAVPIDKVPTLELRRLAETELAVLLDPDEGRPIDCRTRREPEGVGARPWSAIAEAIRRLEDGIVINGAILVGGTWEIDIDVHGRVTGHRYVKGSEPHAGASSPPVPEETP